VDIRAVLADSLRFLAAKPKAFAPRLITTLVYSIFTLYSMGLTVDLIDHPESVSSAQYLGRVAIIFAAMPVLYFLDVLSYAMYPKIVADHRAGGDINLTSALIDGLRAWKVVLALVVFLLGFLLFVVAITSASYAFYLIEGNPVFILASAAMAIVLVLLFSIMMFFVVPVAVLEGKGVMKSFAESISLGIRHRGDLFKLNIIYLILVAVTLALSYVEEANTLASASFIAFFVLIRLVGAVVYTYLSVTNPMAYLQLQINKTPAK
jgi:hypothetical protein